MKLVIQLICFLGMLWAATAACPAECVCSSVRYDCVNQTEAQLAAAIAELSKTPTVLTLNLTSYLPTTLKAEAFKNASQLTMLLISGDTKLTSVAADAFKGLTKLTSLTIRGSRMTTLPPMVFQPLNETLTMLQLDQNKMTTLPDEIFKDLSKLTALTLDQNQLVSLKKDHFEPVKTATISVKTNPYDCACASNKELGKWIMTEKLNISIQCKLPAALNNSILGMKKWMETCIMPTTPKAEPTPTPEPEPGFPDWALVIIIAVCCAIILIVIGIFCQRAKRRDFEEKKRLEARNGMHQAGHIYDNQGYMTG
ncbi:slit homolog 1 protein-like [Lineus longissimus]|uniref:slit homolog 1 protein-like n=1 Tax=Lineus longissimus TaxID=88925 RepID=UPI00315D8FD3